jgi:hypothetical protein
VFFIGGSGAIETKINFYKTKTRSTIDRAVIGNFKYDDRENDYWRFLYRASDAKTEGMI